MRSIKIFLVVAGVLTMPIVPANSASHKPVPPKHKALKSSSAKKASATPKVDSWQPDPALTDNLADEIQVSGYSIRLPIGYSELVPPPEIMAQRPNGFDNHTYSIRRRSDGTASTIGFTIATPPPDVTRTLSLNEALEGTLAQKKQRWQDFTESAVQDGQINGLTFKRVYFKGIVSGAAGTRMAHGLAYVTIDGKNIISFQAEDVEPYNDETIPIAQASVLTFHRQSPK